MMLRVGQPANGRKEAEAINMREENLTLIQFALKAVLLLISFIRIQ
jgi:hypothetical protein